MDSGLVRVVAGRMGSKRGNARMRREKKRNKKIIKRNFVRIRRGDEVQVSDYKYVMEHGVME